jgi:transposase
MVTLWAEVQRLKARLAALEATRHEPRQDAHHSRVPPSHTPQANRSSGTRTGTRRAASVGRAGGGRSRHPHPDQVIMAQATTCPHGGGAVQAHAHHPQAVYDTIEWPPVTPIVTRVEPSGGQCPHGGQSSGAPVPLGMAPGTPVGPAIQSLATSWRSTPALRDVRLSALVAQV